MENNIAPDNLKLPNWAEYWLISLAAADKEHGW